MVVNAILPAVGTGSGAVVSSSQAAANRIKTAIEIIHATHDSTNHIRFWVKNVGSIDIEDIENADVFVEFNDDFSPINATSTKPLACPTTPSGDWWSADETVWKPQSTIEITVCLSGGGTPTRVHFTTANGVTDDEPI